MAWEPSGGPPPSPCRAPGHQVPVTQGHRVSGVSMLASSLAEIIFLRAIMPVYPANHADIIFDITEGNLRDSFDIIKRYMDGMTVGELLEASRPVQTPPGPPGRRPACWHDLSGPPSCL